MRRLAILLAALLSLSGCIEYDEVLSFAADGKGSVKIDMTVDFSWVEKIKKILPSDETGEDEGDWKHILNKEAILRDCESKEIKVKLCEVESKGPKTHVKIEFDFESLEGLRSVRFFSDRDVSFASAENGAETTYKFDGKSILGLAGIGGEDAPPADEKEKKAQQILDEARKGAQARFTLKFPGKVVATNGKAVEGDDKAARFEIAKNDAAAQAKLAKEPFAMRATVAAKDVPFVAKEIEKAKKKTEPEKKPEEKPEKPRGPGGKLGE